MARTPSTDTTADGAPAKAKRTRTPSGPKKVYAIVKVVDASGNRVTMDNGARVELVSFERSAEAVLSRVGPGGDAAGDLLLQGWLPAGRAIGA